MIQAVKGTKDILPDVISNWNFIGDVFRSVSEKYGYRELRTPIFEKTEVFSRSIGEETDIVNKEMYTFTDKGGDSITLRPEMTAALVRSVVQNSLLESTPLLRLWYFGPFFRYERPQKGRLRQFHQYGAECLGSSNPEADVEVILLACSLIKKSGINNYKLLINSLGNENSRVLYKSELLKYLQEHESELSEDSRRRMTTNPLRVLDSKDPRDKKILENAPVLSNYLDEESLKHFIEVKKLLDTAGVQYSETQSLVRGLDYYCHTVFEFQSTSLGAQDSFGGGGRYDKLVEEFGGKSTPAVGFALGVERMLLILEEEALLPKPAPIADVFICSMGDTTIEYTIRISEILREKELKVILDLQRRSFKAQMREANKLEAKWCVIIGESEIQSNAVTLKNMSDGTQSFINLENLSEFQF